MLPPCICRKIVLKEEEEVIPSKHVEVNVTLDKKGNKHGMRSYIYVEMAMQLFCNMMAKLLIDGRFQASQSFSNLEDKIVVVIDLDKSDSDIVLTIRICNRKEDNSREYVQALAILEGPVGK